MACATFFVTILFMRVPLCLTVLIFCAWTVVGTEPANTETVPENNIKAVETIIDNIPQPTADTVSPQAADNKTAFVLKKDESISTNAVMLLRFADRARGNLDGIRWNVTINTTENGRQIESSYDVRARGYNVLAEQTAPRKNKGSLMLVNQGNMWFYKPGISKPVPISRRQRLTGSVSNGDIATTNYAEDYDATFLPEEEVEGELCYMLNLQAKPKHDCTYDRIVLAISKERIVGIKADYYTISGKLFKSSTMQYDHTIPAEDNGRWPFVSKILFTSAIATEEAASLTFSAPELVAIPAGIFDVNRLAR